MIVILVILKSNDDMLMYCNRSATV